MTSAAAPLFAGPKDARFVPASAVEPGGETRFASATSDARARRVAAEFDATVREAALDLGLRVEPAPVLAAPPRASELSSIAPDDWVFAPEVRVDAAGVHLRLLAVAPRSRVTLVREEDLPESELGALGVRAVVMLRDVFEAGRVKNKPARERPTRTAETPAAPSSSGRAVLALNATLFGGYFGYTIQQASDSADSRLVYPLVALGAGLGLGASLLVTDEWDIGTGDAWYLSAATWWPATAGILITESYGGTKSQQHLYGISAAAGGLALGALSLTHRKQSEGGALLAHSGGALGAVLGAMTQMAYEGETGGHVTRGLGYGAAAGVLAGGAAAAVVNLPASRVLFLDLSASLGGLAAAALASPLLLVDDTDPTRTRLWLASAGAGIVAGGVIGWYATSPLDTERVVALPFLPYATFSPAASGGAYELGLSGRW